MPSPSFQLLRWLPISAWIRYKVPTIRSNPITDAGPQNSDLLRLCALLPVRAGNSSLRHQNLSANGEQGELSG